jgi:hypothetical protein
MNLVSSISASYELQIRSLFSLKIPKIILYQVINLLRLILNSIFIWFLKTQQKDQ